VNLAELRRRVNLTLEAICDGQTLPAPLLNRYINDAYSVANNYTLFNLQPLNIATTTGVNNYSVPADFMFLRDVYYIGQRVSWVPYEMLDLKNTITGIPTKLALRANTLYLDPVPDRPGPTITGWYYAQPSDLQNAIDTPLFPREYHRYLADYATAEGLLQFGKLQSAKIYEDRFYKGIQMLSAVYEKDRSREHVAFLRLQSTPWNQPSPPTEAGPPQQTGRG
jgi:hypothetical protein